MRRWLRVVLLAAPILADAPRAQTKVDERLESLVERLGGSDAVQRSAAYLTLLREKPEAAVPLLVELLPRCEVPAQALGLSLLESYPIDVGRPALRKLLRPNAPLLELGAAAFLTRVGEGDFVEHIVRPLAKPDVVPALRVAMLGQLFGMRDARVGEAVRALLVPESAPEVVLEALYHLLQVEDAAARSRARALLSDSTLPAALHVACRAYLLACGDESMSHALAAEVASQGSAALARLARFLQEAPSLGDELLAAVAAQAESTSKASVSLVAIRLLAQHAGPRQIGALERLLSHDDATVVNAALEALQQRGAAVPRPALVSMLSAADPGRVLAAAEALLRMDDESGLSRVQSLAATEGKKRVEALRVLAQYRRRQVVPTLLSALEDPDLQVRSAADLGLRSLLPRLFPYRRFDFESCGYAPAAAPDARRAGAAKLRAWWDAHGS